MGKRTTNNDSLCPTQDPAVTKLIGHVTPRECDAHLVCHLAGWPVGLCGRLLHAQRVS